MCGRLGASGIISTSPSSRPSIWAPSSCDGLEEQLQAQTDAHEPGAGADALDDGLDQALAPQATHGRLAGADAGHEDDLRTFELPRRPRPRCTSAPSSCRALRMLTRLPAP